MTGRWAKNAPNYYYYTIIHIIVKGLTTPRMLRMNTIPKLGTKVHVPYSTNGWSGRGKTNKYRSMLKTERAAIVTGSTVKITGPVPTDSQQ